MNRMVLLLFLVPALALAETPPPAPPAPAPQPAAPAAPPATPAAPPPTTGAPATAAQGKLVVLPILGKLGKPRQRLLEEALIDAAESALSVQVIGPTESRELLTPKQRRALAKCKKEVCFARLAEPLGAAWMLSTQARPAKGQLKLTMALIDGQANVLDRRTPTVAATEPDLGSALKDEMEAMRAVLPKEAAAEAAPPAESAPAVPAAAAPAQAASGAAQPEPTPAAAPSPPVEATGKAEEAAPASSGKPGWLGVQHSTVDHSDAVRAGLDSPRGTLVEGVAKNGPGAAVGLRAGDVIVACSGKAIPSAKHLADILKPARAGDTLVLTV
ncbi:MAG: PDZ domain-containing protein, partial [Deltaproteobacteria bacterium]|nr:PDZ domain-containing protein [Deltaproteobacteria bacterium]